MKRENASFVILEIKAAAELKRFLAEREIQQLIRIELQFSGCCDPALGLRADQMLETDLIQELDGLQFAIDRKTFALVGNVRIGYKKSSENAGFTLTSDQPVSEWEGFGVCQVRL